MKHGETSNILTVFTGDRGILRLMAKGARNSKNKVTMRTDILSVTNISYYFKPQGELHTLSRSEQIVATNKIFDSEKHLNIAVFMLQSLLQTQCAELPAKNVFDFSVQLLVHLNFLTANPFLLFLKHQLLLAQSLGFDIIIDENGSPELSAGIDYHKFDFDEVEILKSAFREDWTALAQSTTELTGRQKVRLLNFFSEYFSQHVDNRFHYTVY